MKTYTRYDYLNGVPEPDWDDDRRGWENYQRFRNEYNEPPSRYEQERREAEWKARDEAEKRRRQKFEAEEKAKQLAEQAAREEKIETSARQAAEAHKQLSTTVDTSRIADLYFCLSDELKNDFYMEDFVSYCLEHKIFCPDFASWTCWALNEIIRLEDASSFARACCLRADDGYAVRVSFSSDYAAGADWYWDFEGDLRWKKWLVDCLDGARAEVRCRIDKFGAEVARKKRLFSLACTQDDYSDTPIVAASIDGDGYSSYYDCHSMWHYFCQLADKMDKITTSTVATAVSEFVDTVGKYSADKYSVVSDKFKNRRSTKKAIVEVRSWSALWSQPADEVDLVKYGFAIKDDADAKDTLLDALEALVAAVDDLSCKSAGN